MKKIKFLLWYRSEKIGDMAPKIIEFEKKAVGHIENLINQNGDIGGLPIQIDFVNINHTLPGLDEKAWLQYKEIVDTGDYTFVRGPGAFGGISKYKIKYLESIASKEMIIFNDTLVPPNLDLNKSNVIDMRSNVFLHATKKKADNFLRNRKLLEITGRTFFIANFSSSSDYWEKIKELEEESIYLCDIDKEEHAEKEKLQKHIDNFLHSSKANDLDMVHLGGVPLAMTQTIINTVQNYDPGITILTGPGNAAYLDYRTTKHPIMLREDSNFDVYLSMESLIEDLGIKLSVKEKQICNQRFSQFEIPLLLKQISDRDKIKSTSKEATVKSIIESLNYTDGKNDIYIGISKDLSFKNNKNNLKTGALVKLALPSKDGSNPVKTLAKNQLSILNEEEKTKSVISFNIDIERITNVSIEDGIFGAEFFIDITSKNEEPLNSIKFNNLSSLNPKHEVRKLESYMDGDLYSSRYTITSNFDFAPIADNYPFDEQFIYIAVSGTDENSQIQPIPEQYIDTQFKIDGWSLVFSKSGINRKKNWVALNSSLNKSPKVGEEIRLGWELKRENSMTLLKIGIPLFFLYILLYYTLFVPADQIETAFNNINLAFLSSIALYFSTERPQPLKMTTIDVVFAFFYIMAGISLISIVFIEFYPDYYDLLVKPLRFLLPTSIVALVVFIKRRLNQRKYKPSITK